MISKIFEILDSGTFIPVLATRLGSYDQPEEWLLAKAGYGLGFDSQSEYIPLSQINGGSGKSTCDPYDWGQNPRTLFTAHRYIIEHFTSLLAGAVVDVQFILGERPRPKTSDRFYGNEATFVEDVEILEPTEREGE